MQLNDNDARAVDMLLGGTFSFRGQAGAAGAAGESRKSSSIAELKQAAGTSGGVSNMSDDLSSRVSHADDLLKLLDYLPAEDPPSNLVERTLQRINEARIHTHVPAHATELNLPAAGRPGIVRSPGAGADDDPAAL